MITFKNLALDNVYPSKLKNDYSNEMSYAIDNGIKNKLFKMMNIVFHTK